MRAIVASPSAKSVAEFDGNNRRGGEESRHWCFPVLIKRYRGYRHAGPPRVRGVCRGRFVGCTSKERTQEKRNGGTWLLAGETRRAEIQGVGQLWAVRVMNALISRIFTTARRTATRRGGGASRLHPLSLRVRRNFRVQGKSEGRKRTQHGRKSRCS